MNEDLRDRVVLPIGIPLAGILIVEVVAFFLSRVLLTAGKIPAVGVALGASLAVLVGAALIVARPRLKTGSIVGLLVLGLTAVIASGAWAINQGPVPLEHEHEEHEAPPAAVAAEVSANNLAFDTSTIELPAGEAATIEFENRETQPHNISIYTDDSVSEALFEGEIITGPGATISYEVPPLDAGSYYFQCDVHPQMNGTVTVA